MSRSTQSPVPRLDLAPKLDRPLSLWNPLDYLRLLYWVFYFPQALRWYIDRYGEEAKASTWQKRWKRLREDPVRIRLWIQGLILTVITPLFLCKLLEAIGVNVDWNNVAISIAVGIGVSLTIGTGVSVIVGTGFSVAFAVMYCVINSVLADAALHLTYSATIGATSGMAIGVAIGTVISLVGGTAGFLILTIAFCMMSIPIFVFGMAPMGSDSVSIASGSVAGGIAILRLEAWFIWLPLMLYKSSNQPTYLAPITCVPLPFLSLRIRQWLQQDWESGIYNINQLLAYTLQIIPVVRAVKQALARTPPDQLLLRLAQIATDPSDWQLILWLSADLNASAKDERDRIPLENRLDPVARLDTPAQAAAAGFWFLYQQSPYKATKTFREVRDLPYGEEMYRIASTLNQCLDAETLTAIAAVQIDPPPTKLLLRPTTWNAIGNFQRVVFDVQVVQQSVSRVARSFALNRAIGELTTLLNNISEIPKAERGLIIRIAVIWEEALQNAASEVGAIVIDQPITNPYVVGDPVVGNLFVGRDDILKRLEELWFVSPQLQSVMLYGHRRMGKTSILRNMEHRLGNGVKIAYVNFLNLGNVAQGVAEVLMAMGDAIAEVGNLPAPADADLLNLPYRTFERFIKQVEKTLEQKRLIIALDEFEKIEHLIQTGQISQDFWEYLRGLVQQSPKIALAFAGLHTLDETIGDYQHPFFASVIPIPVRFLDLGSTQLLLEAPSDEFPLTYAPKVLHQIHDLTAGQPYLVQLIGFQLVRRYNDQVFSQGRTRDPQLNPDDLTAIIQDPEFFNQGRYYFTGVWGQANQDAPGQQAILRALAPSPQGLDPTELMQITSFTAAQLTIALNILKKHDVIQQTDDKWHIIVELFRRWVIDHT